MLLQGEKSRHPTSAIHDQETAEHLAAMSGEFDYIIHPRRNIFDFSLKRLWESGELLYFLTWRDFKIRYKQAIIGAGWAIVKPLLFMLIFVVVFGTFVRVPTGDVPYSIFVYTGLLPWTFVSTVIGTASASLFTNAPLLTKIYFPRLVLPLSSSLLALMDLVVSLPILFGFMLWFDMPITWRVLLLPVLLGLMFLLSLGIGLVMAALHVKYHDVGMLLPLLLQVWMYASPIIYPIQVVSSAWLPIYSLNPLVGLIQGVRWALVGEPSPTAGMMISSVVITLVVLVGGVIFFQYAEDTFADVV